MCKNWLWIMLIIWWIYLINGEIIRAKSITRGKIDPVYKIITMDNQVILIPFTSILKIEEKEL